MRPKGTKKREPYNGTVHVWCDIPDGRRVVGRLVMIIFLVKLDIKLEVKFEYPEED
jgi:hypothetical protein